MLPRTHPPIAATPPRLPRGGFREATALLAAAALTPLSYAQTKPLNDTGITFCGGATSGNNSPCLGTDPVRQDRYSGRDATAMTGALTKTGGSAGAPNGQPNGFDYTKISNVGSPLPANAPLGLGASDWACTRDNVTGLLWEVKTISGLRSMNHTYTWYMTGSPDGNNGAASGGACESVGRCDTEKFVADVNSPTTSPVALCGYRDWRMPTVSELTGIVDLGRSAPAIDPSYFPNTLSSFMWTSLPLV